jgi:hypothetical protein
MTEKQKLSRADMAYAKEVVERIKNAPPLPDVSEEERAQRGRELFEYEGTKFKRYELLRPFVWAHPMSDVGPGSEDYVRIGYIDEKGRRCHSFLHKSDFARLFILVK